MFASLGNSYIRDPLSDLRGGGLAMASQAAGDFIRPSSATQWVRLAAVGGQYPSLNATPDWVMSNAVGAAAHPVGSVYESVLSTNPATLMGFGTWVAFGTGRVTVGINAADVDFDTVEETGGSNTHTLTTAEMPAHNHVQDSHNHTQNSHTHTQNAHSHNVSGIGNSIQVAGSPNTSVVDITGSKTTGDTTATNQSTTATNNAATATNQNAGGGAAHTNVQPSITIYRWKRTA